MNYVKSLKVKDVDATQIPCLTGHGEPATDMGAVGCLYMDTDSGYIYKCTNTQNNIYLWELETSNIQLPTDYIDECNAVMDKVQSEPADLRLVLFADPHEFGKTKYTKYNALLTTGCVDGLVGLGDYQIYSNTITKTETIRKITEVLSCGGRNPNCFYAIGNHDVAYVSANGGNVDQSKVLTKKEMHDCFGRHLNGFAHFNDADPYGGYYYVDYDAAKIRMIILNTSDIYEADGSLQYKYTESVMMQQPQITWFAEKALDFSGKENRNEWSVLVCLHAYFDSQQGMLASILSAVKNGTAVNKSWAFERRLMNGTSTVDNANPVTITINKDYSTQGAVDVIGVLYGHDHENTESAHNGIPFIEFICDNDDLDDFYVASTATPTNLLPFDKVTESYSSVGVTITHENGVFVVDGTSTGTESVELVPANGNYGTLKAGVTYSLGMDVLSGTVSQWLKILIRVTYADGTTKAIEIRNDTGTVSFTPDEDCTLSRFAFNIPYTNCVFEDFTVAPFVEEDMAEGLKAGGYYITNTNGAKMGFTVTEDVPDAVTIGYNNYFGSGGTRAPIRIQDADGKTIKTIWAYASNYTDGMTEITGLVQERTPDTVKVESCSVVSINKDTRTIRVIPYGTGIRREISY